MNTQRSLTVHLGLLFALCAGMYFVYLGRSPFFDKGEPREAIAVQDILQRGEWLFPLKRATVIPSKPPLFHWSAALIARVSGRADEAAIRFPSALYATLGVLVIYLFGRRAFGPQPAFFGAAILATTSVYATQALSARVDMTLSFFVTLTLVLFYSLDRGFITGRLWRTVFYAAWGIGTLAKGPLGLLLPGLVIGVYLALNKRWAALRRLVFHPGVILTLVLAFGWYVIAIMRAGEGFVDKQLLQENLERFVGGSGHTHPVHYYGPYLFALGLPWSLFFPLLFWDSFRALLRSRDEVVFLQLWFVAMFVFFSASMGKRPVYLLPLYPALSLLLGVWIHEHAGTAARLIFYRALASVLALTGLLLVVITIGGLWNHDPGWFFGPIEDLLKPKDRANLAVVRNDLASFGWSFTLVSLLSAVLWLWLARCFWRARLKHAAYLLVLLSISTAFITRGIVIPQMAQARSYRDFMRQVNERLKADDRLYLYGEEFNSDPVIFYRGAVIEPLAETMTNAIVGPAGSGSDYLIMTEQRLNRLQHARKDLSPPIVKSDGKGPEGDAPLVLVRLVDS